MADNTLNHAEGLIREGKYDDARQMLIAYLKHNADSADAWWLLSQTIDDKDQQIDCLKRVLSIDPNHAPARIYLAEIEDSLNASPFTVPIGDEAEEYASFEEEKPLYSEEDSYNASEETPEPYSETYLYEDEWAEEKEDLPVAQTPPPAKRKKQAPTKRKKKKGINKGLIAFIIILFILGISGIAYFGWIIIQSMDSNPIVASPPPTAILETATPVPPQSLPPTWTPTFTPEPSPTPTSLSNSG